MTTIITIDKHRMSPTLHEVPVLDTSFTLKGIASY